MRLQRKSFYLFIYLIKDSNLIVLISFVLIVTHNDNFLKKYLKNDFCPMLFHPFKK